MSPKKSKLTPWRAKCCVEGCSVRICSGVSMHGFPRQDRYPDLYEHWLEAIRVANSAPHWKPQKSSKVCAFHFETVEDVRIRVPTLFPYDERKASTSNEPDDYDEDEEEDPTQGTCEYDDDPMDTYEDSLAVDSIVEENSGLPYDDTDMPEDPSATYEEIEQEYNNIVGDVVSTLVTYDNVIGDSSIVFNDMEEQNTATLYAGVADEQAALYDSVEAEPSQSNDVVEEEIVYEDIYNESENSMQAEFLPTQDGVDQDDDYCVVVVRHDPNEPGHTNELEPSKKQLQQETLEESTTKKPPNKKSTKRTRQPKSKKSSKKSSPKTSKSKPGTCQTAKPNPGESESVVEEQQASPSKALLEHLEGEELLANAEPEEGSPRKSSPVNNSPITKHGLLEEPAEDDQKTLPCQAKWGLQSDSADVKVKGIEEVKIGEMSLDGVPIKLKKCSVNLIKSPIKLKSNATKPMPKSKKEALISKASSSKKRDNPKGNLEQHPEKANEVTSKGPVDFLGALSLKSTQEEESSGLRRSARIRAGAGKKRRFGRRSWSVAFKETPKKKQKLEIDSASVSSESVPYDFEAEDDPDVAPGDLDDSESDSSDSWVSDVNDDVMEDGETSSSYRRKSKTTPASNANGVTTRKRTMAHFNRGRHHGHQRVRIGDQATQVGLPGSCDGFIFDVVRDDPRNVGVSCNIFYHYQPKRGSRCSGPIRSGRPPKLVDVPSTETTKNGVKPNLPSCSFQKSNPIDNHKRVSSHSEDFEWGKIIEPPQNSVSYDDSRSDVLNELPGVKNTDNIRDTRDTHKGGDVIVVGDVVGIIKVENAMESAPSLDNATHQASDASNLDIKEQDPNDLSGIIRIDDALSSKTTDEVEIQPSGVHSNDNETLTLPSKDIDAQTDSVDCSKPKDMGVESAERSMSVECIRSSTTPEPGGTADGQSGPEYSDGVTSSHADVAEVSADAAVPENGAEPMDTSEARPQTETGSESFEYTGNITDFSSGVKVDLASDSKNEDSTRAENVGTSSISNNVSTGLLEDWAQQLVEVRDSLAKEGSGPLGESQGTLEDPSPAPERVVEDERISEAQIDTLRSSRSEQCDPAIISSNPSDCTDVVLDAPMDSGHTLPDSGCDDGTAEDVTPPPEKIDIHTDSGLVEDDGVTPEILDSTEDVDRSVNAPINLVDIQTEDNMIPPAEVPGGRKDVDSPMETIELDSNVNDPESPGDRNASADSIECEPEILGKSTGATIDSSIVPEYSGVLAVGSPAEAPTCDAPSVEEPLLISSDGEEPVLISSDSSDEERSPSASNQGLQQSSEVGNNRIRSVESVQCSQSTDSTNTTQIVHRETDIDSERPQSSQPLDPSREANHSRNDSSQEVFDSIERNLEKMFDMYP